MFSPRASWRWVHTWPCASAKSCSAGVASAIDLFEGVQMRKLLFLASLIATLAYAAPLPYDESADAKPAVKQALDAAQATQLPELVIFVANWCPDCRALDQELQTRRNAELAKREFNGGRVEV